MNLPFGMHSLPKTAAGDLRMFFRTLAGFATAALVMVGAGSLVYLLVTPGGALAQLFGRGLAGGLAALLAMFMIGLAAWMAGKWIPQRHRTRTAELFAYGFAAAGLLQLGTYILKGAM